jgi:hypothetical protein
LPKLKILINAQLQLDYSPLLQKAKDQIQEDFQVPFRQTAGRNVKFKFWKAQVDAFL